jgi:LacI family transcriptional regulator
MTSNKDITIYDLAEELNLSPATVSRALKNNPIINAETRKKILDLAAKRGYRSNAFASNLRTQKTNTIGVIVHELNSYFMTAVLAGIEEVATEAGYDILIAHSNETVAKERTNAHNLFNKRVDGVIASLAYDTDDLTHFEPFIKKHIPLLFFDRIDNSIAATQVVIDNVEAGYQATKHLIQQGCKRIVHATANLKRNVYADRLAGYKKALLEHQLPYNESLVLVNDFKEDTGKLIVEQILAMKQQPDGLFVTNDFCSAVCIAEFKKTGIKVPKDIAVVGFNNDVVSRMVEPNITTINYPGKLMGRTIAERLVLQLKTKKNINKQEQIIVPSELIVRDSSKRKK